MITANFEGYASYTVDSLYQWDIDRTLAIAGLTLNKRPEIPTSPVSDTNTNVGVVIHTIPETVGTPIINAREASDLSVTIRPSESYVRKVCPDSVIKITKGSREIRLITASTTTRMTVWFLVEPEETGVDIHTHIVDTLPTEGIETNSIYFLESNANSNNDKYDEYVYINGEWERLGGSAYLDTNVNAYSANERVVGSWIDGKPIYQKTINAGDLPNNTNVVVYEDSMIDLVINVEGIAISKSATSTCRPIPFVGLQSNDIRVDFTNGQVKLTTITDWSMYTGILTLQYTKTSDNSIGTMDSPQNYSTDEKIVGKWIDGSLLYQKTVYIDSLPNNSTKNIAHGIANISSIIGIDSYVKWASGGWIADLPWVVSGDDTETITVSAGLSSIQIVTKKDRTSMSAYVTLRYTKTS